MPRSSRKKSLDDHRTRPGDDAAAASQHGGWIAPEAQSAAGPGAAAKAGGQSIVVPLVQEEVQLGARAVETGRVRIVKRVREEEQLVQRPLLREAVDVQRVPIEQFVEQVPEVREEGNVLIVPVVEEVLVIEKRLMLKEELRISRQRTSEPYSTQVTVRTEEADIERLPPRGSAEESPAVPRSPRK